MWELDDDTLTIWGGYAGSPASFKGKFSDEGDPEVNYKQFKSKDYTAVYIDSDGDGKAEASIKLLGLHKLKDGDFVL